jgi:hypothetical protein
MFFAEGEEKEFPEEIRVNINRLESKDKEIYDLNKKNRDINLEVINFVIDSLNLFLKYEDKLSLKQKDLMTEAIGNIPITFFILDKLRIKKNVKDIINPLVDIIDAHANLHINRIKLIKDVLEELIDEKVRLEKDGY